MLVPKPLAEISFRKHVVNKTLHAKPKRQLQPSFMKVGPQCLKRFREKMAAHAPELIWNRYATGKAARLINTSPINDTEDLHSPKCLQFVYEYFRNLVPLTAAEKEEVHLKTLGQSQNPTW
ncbi:hypothetical protein HPB52_019080 [Rhipicephalus sanguineus]|uniref:Uncharacterized protein n=1 Tax=Rhipicephalus sanguineus TaxID=34632 RepID=A0A9D4T619_RHISA|nr:hypothetical protein HPB52_019080 [Rhipicephalus sanguineus]